MGLFTDDEIRAVYNALKGVDTNTIQAAAANDHRQTIVAITIPGTFAPKSVGIVAEMLRQQNPQLRVETAPAADGSGVTLSIFTGEYTDVLLNETNAQEAGRLKPRADFWKGEVAAAIDAIKNKQKNEVIQGVRKAFEEDQQAVNAVFAATHTAVRVALKREQNVALVIDARKHNYFPAIAGAVDAAAAVKNNILVFQPLPEAFLKFAADNPERNHFFSSVAYARDKLGAEFLVGNAAGATPLYQSLKPEDTNEKRKEASDEYARAMVATMTENNKKAGQKLIIANAEYPVFPKNTVILDLSGLDPSEKEYNVWRYGKDVPGVGAFMQKLGTSAIQTIVLEGVTPQHPVKMRNMINAASSDEGLKIQWEFPAKDTDRDSIPNGNQPKGRPR